MELPSFLVTSLQQPEPLQKKEEEEEEVGKQYPVNSSHFSPYKDYARHSPFAKRSTFRFAPSQSPLQRAKEVLSDMHYSYGRVHRIQPLLASSRVGKLAPGPCSPDFKRPIPPFPEQFEEEKSSTSLEKGFAKVKLQLPALKRPENVHKSTSPRGVCKTIEPILSPADKEKLQIAFRTRLKTLKTTMTRRIRNKVSKQHKYHIFTEEINDFRAQTSLSSAIEYQ